jgi:excisionase family DNA binding protein
MIMDQRYLRVEQAAQFLGVSRWTVHRLVKEQRIPFIPVRGRIVFDKEDLVSWMHKLKVPARSSSSPTHSHFA